MSNLQLRKENLNELTQLFIPMKCSAQTILK